MRFRRATNVTVTPGFAALVEGFHDTSDGGASGHIAHLGVVQWWGGENPPPHGNADAYGIRYDGRPGMGRCVAYSIAPIPAAHLPDDTLVASFAGGRKLLDVTMVAHKPDEFVTLDIVDEIIYVLRSASAPVVVRDKKRRDV